MSVSSLAMADRSWGLSLGWIRSKALLATSMASSADSRSGAAAASGPPPEGFRYACTSSAKLATTSLRTTSTAGIAVAFVCVVIVLSRYADDRYFPHQPRRVCDPNRPGPACPRLADPDYEAIERGCCA